MDENNYLGEDVKKARKADEALAKRIKRNVILATETKEEKRRRLKRERKRS